MSNTRIDISTLSALAIVLFVMSARAQTFDLIAFLDKADLATTQYQKTFANLVAEELRDYQYFRKDGSVDDSRKIRSTILVYRSPKTNLVAEYRNVIEFNGKIVARDDKDIAKFFDKLLEADSSGEEMSRIQKEGNRFDGKSQSYGMTLTQAFVLNRYFRPFFEYRLAGKDQIAGHDLLVVEYKQIRPTGMIKANATDEERKRDPKGLTFDTELPDSFRPTNPRLQGRLWLDAATAQLWRNEFSVTIHPAVLSKAVVSAEFSYEYEASAFGILLPKKFSIVGYSFSGKGENDLRRTKALTKTFEYSKFSKPDSEIKQVNTRN